MMFLVPDSVEPAIEEPVVEAVVDTAADMAVGPFVVDDLNSGQPQW